MERYWKIANFILYEFRITFCKISFKQFTVHNDRVHDMTEVFPLCLEIRPYYL
jgi:hypothetical protein